MEWQELTPRPCRYCGKVHNMDQPHQTKRIDQHEGSKYVRKIYSCNPNPRGGDVPEFIWVDVYSVTEAFEVKDDAVAHAVKKLLCPGQRGKGDYLADLIGAEAALSRAIEKAKRAVALEEQEAGPDERARTLGHDPRGLSCVKCGRSLREIIRHNTPCTPQPES